MKEVYIYVYVYIYIYIWIEEFAKNCGMRGGG